MDVCWAMLKTTQKSFYFLSLIHPCVLSLSLCEEQMLTHIAASPGMRSENPKSCVARKSRALVPIQANDLPQQPNQYRIKAWVAQDCTQRPWPCHPGRGYLRLACCQENEMWAYLWEEFIFLKTKLQKMIIIAIIIDSKQSRLQTVLCENIKKRNYSIFLQYK